jgi:hypothetical protein
VNKFNKDGLHLIQDYLDGRLEEVVDQYKEGISFASDFTYEEAMLLQIKSIVETLIEE